MAGNTYPISVDDIVPMYKPVVDQSYFIMADAINNTFWGPLLEKAYAKFTGSYEHIALGGIASEAMRAVAQLPGFLYQTANYPNNTFWFMMDQALRQGDIVTASTPSGYNSTAGNQVLNMFGINLQHAYSVLGTYNITNQTYDGQPGTFTVCD